MQPLIQHFLGDESGATAIEYGLIVSLIAVAILSVLATIGVNLNAKMQEIADAVAAAGS